MSPLKIKNDFLGNPTSVAMFTYRRTVYRAHFALWGLFLAISEHTFKILTTGPRDKFLISTREI